MFCLKTPPSTIVSEEKKVGTDRVNNMTPESKVIHKTEVSNSLTAIGGIHSRSLKTDHFDSNYFQE